MWFVTNINADNTISVKVPEQNSTIHYTIEELEQNKYAILGVYRNNMGHIIEIHPVEAQSVSEGLMPCINLIQTPEIREFADNIRRVIPKYFFEVAASHSGKYHPASNLGYGGLLRHTIFVCENLKHITDLESTRLMFQLTQEQIDLMLVACMMHDAFKQGFDKNIADFSQHPNISARIIRGMVGLFPTDNLEFIAKCVETHMGEWNTDRNGAIITRKPTTYYEWLVHLADYMGSRPNKSITINNTVYYKKGEFTECCQKEKEVLSTSQLDVIKKVYAAYKNMPIKSAIKTKYNIERTDAEVLDIWQTILKYGVASEKQQKYVELANRLHITIFTQG